jgi:hypothetical protein
VLPEQVTAAMLQKLRTIMSLNNLENKECVISVISYFLAFIIPFEDLLEVIIQDSASFERKNAFFLIFLEVYWILVLKMLFFEGKTHFLVSNYILSSIFYCLSPF